VGANRLDDWGSKETLKLAVFLHTMSKRIQASYGPLCNVHWEVKETEQETKPLAPKFGMPMRLLHPSVLLWFRVYSSI
jgi:hypothetical protein